MAVILGYRETQPQHYMLLLSPANFLAEEQVLSIAATKGPGARSLLPQWVELRAATGALKAAHHRVF